MCAFLIRSDFVYLYQTHLSFTHTVAISGCCYCRQIPSSVLKCYSIRFDTYHCENEIPFDENDDCVVIIIVIARFKINTKLEDINEDLFTTNVLNFLSNKIELSLLSHFNLDCIFLLFYAIQDNACPKIVNVTVTGIISVANHNYSVIINSIYEKISSYARKIKNGIWSKKLWSLHLWIL